MRELLSHTAEDIGIKPEGREHLVELALQLEGSLVIRYSGRERGVDPQEGFDCSGYVSYLLDQLGYERGDLRHCREYFAEFGGPIELGQQQRGDLVFFSWNGNTPQHMGIMLSARAYIHALLKRRTVTVSALRFYDIVPNDKTFSPQRFTQNPIGFRRLEFST